MKALARLLLASLAAVSLLQCASTSRTNVKPVTVKPESLGAYDCVERAANIASPPPRDPFDLGMVRDQNGRKITKMAGRKALLDVQPCGGSGGTGGAGGRVPLSKTRALNNVAKGNPLLRPNQIGIEEFFQRKPSMNVFPWEKVYYIPPGPDREPHKARPDPPGCNGVNSFGTCYYYGPASFNTVADGGGMTMRIERPAFSGSGHSLDEIAAQGGAGNGNIVELGWNVSPVQYSGDTDPHMFIFHWINWSPTCYDTCGWVQYSATYFPGMNLSALIGRDVYVGYVFWNGNWWAWFDIQWFGEVATDNGIPPNVQMGNGLFPTDPSAAINQTLCDVDAAAWVCWYRDLQSLGPTYPPYFDIRHTGFGQTRFGGPGT
jgi:hypothetical protein